MELLLLIMVYERSLKAISLHSLARNNQVYARSLIQGPLHPEETEAKGRKSPRSERTEARNMLFILHFLIDLLILMFVCDNWMSLESG